MPGLEVMPPVGGAETELPMSHCELWDTGINGWRPKTKRIQAKRDTYKARSVMR